MNNIDEARVAVVAETYTWLRTPYHHQQRVKGAGVDCVWILLEIYRKFGYAMPRPIPDDYDPGNYSAEWFLHKSEEIYMEGVAKYATQLEKGEKPKIGDVALYKVGYCVSHGAVIVGDNLAIHANRRAGNVELVLLTDGDLERYFHSYWTPFR